MKPVPAAPWKIALALACVYLSWGTTYLAIEIGVHELPPGLFGGVRLFLAGLLVLLFWVWRGHSIQMTWSDTFWLWVTGSFLFVGGNGLLSLAERSVPSGLASVLVATSPLWLALVEACSPGGDRPTPRAWIGLLCGMAGVVVLMSGRLIEAAQQSLDLTGPLLGLTSAFSWAVGSAIYRRHRGHGSPVCMAAWQMTLGGGTLALLGLAGGEVSVLADLTRFPLHGVVAFFYLLVVGSLIGFLAYIWLLSHVSAALAGTYAYVNPLVALLIGWLFAKEIVTLPVLVGMAIILVGIGLVRSVHHVPTVPTPPMLAEEVTEDADLAIVPIAPPGD